MTRYQGNGLESRDRGQVARSAWIFGLVKGRSSAADERGASQRESASALVMQNCCLEPSRAASICFLEPLMICKSPLIERLHQIKKTQSLRKGLDTLYYIIKITANVYRLTKLRSESVAFEIRSLIPLYSSQSFTVLPVFCSSMRSKQVKLFFNFYESNNINKHSFM